MTWLEFAVLVVLVTLKIAAWLVPTIVVARVIYRRGEVRRERDARAVR